MAGMTPSSAAGDSRTLTARDDATGATGWRDEYQIDVADHPAVALWLRDVARRDPEGFIRLVGPNVDDFHRLFGKPDWNNDGEKGWTHGWSLYENSMHWLVLTGPRGTYFRLRVPVPGDIWLADPKVGAGINHYLDQLLRRLNS